MRELACQAVSSEDSSAFSDGRGARLVVHGEKAYSIDRIEGDGIKKTVIQFTTSDGLSCRARGCRGNDKRRLA